MVSIIYIYMRFNDMVLKKVQYSQIHFYGPKTSKTRVFKNLASDLQFLKDFFKPFFAVI